jgi:cellulose synthase/poly-beta-1,6-N-acetylglucosamine synthase-like glycosyltransferase
MTIFCLLNLPVICSGDQHSFKCLVTYSFKHRSFSILFLLCVFLSFALLFAQYGEYLPLTLFLLISLRTLVGPLAKTRLFSSFLIIFWSLELSFEYVRTSIFFRHSDLRFNSGLYMTLNYETPQPHFLTSNMKTSVSCSA